MKTIYHKRIFLMSLLATLIINISFSQIRKYNKIRYRDNFSMVHQDTTSQDLFDPIKYIDFSSSHPYSLSLGGEVRHQYQWYQNPEWRGTVDQNGHFLQRYMLHADLRLGHHFRVFTQLNSGFSNGRNPNPRFIIDENRFEINQAFVELSPFANKGIDGFNLGIRIGRMEQLFGTGRFIATREGQNIRRSFDGVHIFAKHRKWQFDAFALKQIASRPGAFDDFVDRDELMAGFVARKTNAQGVSWEPYILLNDDRSSTVFTDTSGQWRLSPGIRFFKNKASGLAWNIESVFQWGRFMKEDMYAWLMAGDISYQFRDKPIKPTIGFSASYGSGDSDGERGGMSTLETFYPKGVFGQAAVLNPANLTQLTISLGIQPKPNLKINISHDQLFRNSVADVIYDPCSYQVVEIREDMGSARYVGHHTRLSVRRQFGLHYFILFEYAVMPPGKFLKEMGRTEVLHYATMRSVFRF